MSLDAEIDALYELPPERFTTARNELAARLRTSGNREGAAGVKGLRKPTLTAWALNQLPRRQRGELEELLAAGEALRTAQRRALSGVEPREFREAMERRRRLVQTLTRRAAEVLAEVGRTSQSAEDELGRTLEAASADPETGRALLEGRLEKPITTASGFDAVGGFTVVEGPSEGGEAGPDDRAVRRAKETGIRNAERQAEKAEADAHRARVRAQTLAADLEDLVRRSAAASREADELEEVARAARERLDRLRDEN